MGCVKEAYYPSQLFNPYGEHGMSIGKKRISNLRYADHTTLIALGEDGMAELVNLAKIASKKLGTISEGNGLDQVS